MKKENKKHGGLHTFILSLIFAVAIWVMVGIVNDPDIRNTITSLPVRYIGVSELADKGLVIIAPEAKTTSAVTVSGKRRDLIRYGSEVYISIDVSGIDAPGEYTMKGVAQLSNDRISIVRERLGDIDIIAEKISEKEIPVEIKQTGSSKNTLVKPVPQLSTIKVSGAESEVTAVSKALISIDTSKVHENSTMYSDFKLCDESGTALTKAHTLSAGESTIAVDLTVYEKKSLPVKLKLSDEFESMYLISTENSSISTSTVDVGVLPECEAECVYVNIDKVSGESGDFRLIEEEGMYIPPENSVVRVKPHLTAVTSRHTDISVRAQNLADGKSADFADTLTGILLIAPEEVLNSGNFHLVIDLEGLDDGEHRVKARISDENIRIAEEIFVDVVIH